MENMTEGEKVQTSDREHMSSDQASSHREHPQKPTSHFWYVWAKDFLSAQEERNFTYRLSKIKGTFYFLLSS